MESIYLGCLIKMKEVLIKTLFILSILFLLPLVSSSDIILKKNTDSVISVQCSFNNTQCSANALCNHTLYAPNQTKLFNHSVTVNSNSFFDVDINGNNLSNEGEYLLKLFCFDQGIGDSIEKSFIVTNSGRVLSTAQGIVFVIILFISILLFLFVSVGALFIPSGNERDEENKVISISDLKYVKMVLFAFSYLLFMWIIFMLMELSSNFMIGDTASRIFTMVFYTLFYSIVPLFLGFIIFWIMLKFQDKKFNEMLQRGIFVDKV